MDLFYLFYHHVKLNFRLRIHLPKRDFKQTSPRFIKSKLQFNAKEETLLCTLSNRKRC